MGTFTSKADLEKYLQEMDPEWWELLPQGKENVYTCNTCRKYIVTIDLDRGVTPMFLGCRESSCSGEMTSHGYPPMENKPDIVPDAWWEWYRPAEIDTDDDHLMKGGLLLRERLRDDLVGNNG